MLRIFVFSSQALRKSGGIENTTYYLCRELAKEAGVDAFMHRRQENEPIDGVEYHPAKSKMPVLQEVRQLYAAQKNAARSGDRCISLALTWSFGVAPYIVHKLLGTPYIVMAHGNEVLKAADPGLARRLKERLRTRVLRNAAAVCANSRFTAELVKKNCPQAPIRIIHPCSGEEIDENETVRDGRYMLSVGRLEERKGFQYAVEAFAKLKDNHPGFNYYIAGKGPYQEKLQQLIDRLGLQERCVLKGRVSEEEKAELLKNCTLFTMPSFYLESAFSVEGFGVVFLEANAHGKPVIGTVSGGIPDAILPDRTGLLVQEKDADGLAAAIESILTREKSFDPAECRAWAKRHYYPAIAAEYLSLIRECLS
jgi:phosphatidylinositol alpha-1,6-mannosyltransferase